MAISTDLVPAWLWYISCSYSGKSCGLRTRPLRAYQKPGTLVTVRVPLLFDIYSILCHTWHGSFPSPQLVSAMTWGPPQPPKCATLCKARNPNNTRSTLELCNGVISANRVEDIVFVTAATAFLVQPPHFIFWALRLHGYSSRVSLLNLWTMHYLGTYCTRYSIFRYYTFQVRVEATNSRQILPTIHFLFYY